MAGERPFFYKKREFLGKKAVFTEKNDKRKEI